MKFSEIGEKNEKELHDALQHERESLRQLRFKSTDGQLKEVRKIRNSRRMVAKILTAINQRRNK